MEGHPLILADTVRAEQFALLGRTCRPFHGHQVHTDAQGITWALKRLGSHALAVTWLGQGWVFDPGVRERRAQELASRHEAMEQADDTGHARELADVLRRVRLGPLAERLLWAIHQEVMRVGSSVIDLMDTWLATRAWGPERPAWPRHWRADLLRILEGLAYLHLAEWPEDGTPPALGADTALLSHAGDLRRSPGDDVCDDDCPGRHEPAHHHYRVAIGRGFLGVLEQFAGDDSDGVRSYDFPVWGPAGGGPTLRQVGKSGRLVSIYLPARLGDPAACGALSPAQHRLLQALVRETTRARAGRRARGPARPEVVAGNRVPTFSGKGTLLCPLLSPQGEYVGFNGNGARRGQGYRLCTEGGWLARAGYSPDDVQRFLADLAALATTLGLVPVGVLRGGRWLDLDQLVALAASAPGRPTLRELHLRLFSRADYLARWNAHFGWADSSASPAPQVADPTVILAGALEQQGIRRRALARGIDVDPSFLSKVLNGQKRCPEGLLEKALDWIAGQDGPERAGPAPGLREKAAVRGVALAC